MSATVSDGVFLSGLSAPPELRTTTFGAPGVVTVFSVGDCATGAVPLVIVDDCVPVVAVDGIDTGDDEVAVEPEVFVESDEFAGPAPASEVVASESGVADATPGVVATAIPTPRATANAPTLPMYLA